MSSKKESRLDSLLHSRARSGDVEGVRQILDTGRVHVDCKDQEWSTPLLEAISGGKSDCVKLLLDEGADPNIKKKNGVSGMFLASQAGYQDMVNLLLSAGAQPDPLGQDGGTPLMAACQAGHFDVVQTLVNKGADINRTTWHDGAGPLFLSCQNGHTRVVVFLLSVKEVIVDQQRRDGASSLWIASQMGHDDIVRLLLKAGAAVDLPRSDGATALFKACHKGHREVVKQLLMHNPDMGLLKNGETVLHAAVLSGDVVVVDQLVLAGANPDQVNMAGLTALDVAKDKNKEIKEKLRPVTNKTTDPRILARTQDVSRSLTPDKLSELRNGSAVAKNGSILRRSNCSLKSKSPLTTEQTSPMRSTLSRLTRSPSTCPSTPTTSSPATTPKHSVHFIDPVLYKDGVIVTKVQCKIVEARTLLCRDKSPVRYINLSNGDKSRDMSPVRLCTMSPTQSFSTTSSLTRSTRTH